MDGKDASDSAGYQAAAERVEQALVLAIGFEPPDAMTPDIFGLSDEALRRVVALTLARVDVIDPVEVSLLLTDDTGLRALNRDYRGKDEATDVLSFPLLEAPLVIAPAEQLWSRQENGHSGPDSIPEDELADEFAGDEDVAPLDDEGALDEGEPDDGDGEEADWPGVMTTSLGDIAISRDAVSRQAAAAGHSARWELAYLLAHGVLHLVGYDDHTEAGYAAMVAHQEAALRAAGLNR
jgi:probable rRNA maturation factor